MTRPAIPVGDDDLNALADGRLTPERTATVEAYLASNPDHAARIEADREIRRSLRERLADKANEPIPPRLRAAAILAERRRALRARLVQAAAALLLVFGGAGAGWLGRDLIGRGTGFGSAPLAEEALAAHRTFAVEVVHPVEVKADQEAHLAQWLSKRLGRKLTIPDLQPVGLSLIGGRLLPAGSDVAAQLMYAGRDGTRVTLYVRCGERRRVELRTARQGDLGAAYWADGSYGYALSAPLDRDRLLMIARAAHSEMDDARRM